MSKPAFTTLHMRLCLMMFLQFFIWGAWFVTLGTYLGNTLQAPGSDVALAFGTQSWGAILSPFFIGLIADRYFNAEKVLGVLHLIGAALMWQLYQAQDFAAFYPIVFLYMLCFMPTLALVNSVSFGQLSDANQEFGKIRLWGTAGWIIAGLVISFVFSWDSGTGLASGALRNTFLMASLSSFLLGIYAFTLPPTTPAGKSENKSLGAILGFDALALLKDRDYLIFFVASVLICIPLAFYYSYANPFLTDLSVPNATGIMTLGQMSELLFLLALPWFLQRFGIKKTLLLGMLAWALRYIFFAYGNADSRLWMLFMGIVLHGICYDFFFVCGQIYTSQKAEAKIQSAAQGLITLATYGVGMLIGYAVSGALYDTYSNQDGINWLMIWLLPALFSLVILALFLISFRDQSSQPAK
jgi:nucleoside transporter